MSPCLFSSFSTDIFSVSLSQVRTLVRVIKAVSGFLSQKQSSEHRDRKNTGERRRGIKKMQQRDSLSKKSKKLFNRTLHSLKHFILFDGYQKLHKSSSFRAFSCASCRDLCGKAPQTEESYPGFSGRWPLMGEVEKGGEPSGSVIAEKKVSDPEEEERAKKAEKINPPPSSTRAEGDGFVLSRKMKELEMMEVGDMEHVLDIEEALHYYSRLTSPVYVGIVDKFFMDMYSDFTPCPAPPAAKRLVARDSRQRRAVVRPWR